MSGRSRAKGRTVDAFCSCKWAGGARRRPRPRLRQRVGRLRRKGQDCLCPARLLAVSRLPGTGRGHRPQAGAGAFAAGDLHGLRADLESRHAAVHGGDPVERGPCRYPRLSGVGARSRPIPRAFRCSTSRAARSKIDRPGLVPGRCFSAPGRADVQQRIQRSSTSRSLLQPAQQIMTLVFDACSSSVRMASRCSGVPEITRCSQAPQIPSSQE